ncbi:MAG TPA: tetratricopeptide repeat protein [Bryobacteraceae bacterium]|nr:tetratricopeptide repeat protein [Bryobacteraceae bacterium]
MKRWASLAVLACATVTRAQTYTKDVAPILLEFCAPCHRPGEAAPFSLLDYSDAKRHAKQIVAVTQSRYMPPWKPAPGRGEFEGERRLSDAQLQTLASWAKNGSLEGDPKDLPARPTFVEGWQLGTPDLVVTLERPYSLAASGPDVFRNFVLRPAVDRTRYVRAAEIRPGAKKVVHHANVLIDRQRSMRRRDGKDGAPGFAGMDVQIEPRTFDPESHFLFWKPGTTVLEEPADMAWRLDPGTDLVLNMHLQPSGKSESIQPSIGLYFTDRAPTRQPMLVQLENDGALTIPPGGKNFVVTDTLTMPVDVEVLGLYPHAHYIGKDLQAFATLPDGSRCWLIHIPDWDLNWQAVYRYKRPVLLPRGSVVSMRYTYDNSADNPRNPHRPPVRVVAGDRSEDEMAHLWLQLLPRSQAGSDARAAVQQASLERRLAKYPNDFAAHFGLGALLQSEDKLDEAIDHYRKALSLAPQNATAHNSLASALLAQGDVDAAEAEFRKAIELDQDYADAHYNLARLLLQKQELETAIRHLREVIRIEPLDAPALSDLGAALIMTGQMESGFRYLQQAVQSQPDYFNGRFNLAQALAGVGKFEQARAELREALRIRPGDPDALRALEEMRGQR